MAQLDLVWLLCKCARIRRNSEGTLPDNAAQDQNETVDSDREQANDLEKRFIPTWSAFNSVIQERQHQLTRVCVLPILPSSPTDHSVQLTFLTHLERLTKHICGDASKCVVTLDLGLYKPVQQLLMSRADHSGRWVLRPGDLHISFAFIRAIGSFVDGTGIPELWSLMYSDSTVNSIIAGKNFRRALEAHLRTLAILQQCYFAAFF